MGYKILTGHTGAQLTRRLLVLVVLKLSFYLKLAIRSIGERLGRYGSQSRALLNTGIGHHGGRDGGEESLS